MVQKRLKGGPWTREDPADPNIKSALDLVIVSNDLYEFVDRMKIDSKREITPFKSDKNKVLNFTDHYTIVVDFKNIPLKHETQI